MVDLKLEHTTLLASLLFFSSRLLPHKHFSSRSHLKTQHIRTVITNILMSINNCQERSRGIGQIYQLPGWKANLLSVITAFSFSLSPGTAKTSLLLKRFNLLSPTGRKLPVGLQGYCYSESCCKELAGDGRK